MPHEEQEMAEMADEMLEFQGGPQLLMSSPCQHQTLHGELLSPAYYVVFLLLGQLNIHWYSTSTSSSMDPPNQVT